MDVANVKTFKKADTRQPSEGDEGEHGGYRAP